MYCQASTFCHPTGVQKIRSIVGILGFFSIVTTPHLLVQKTAAGDPDCVVGYSTDF
jgi:hypothetical protein